jgi:hypothetical protein
MELGRVEGDNTPERSGIAQGGIAPFEKEKDELGRRRFETQWLIYRTGAATDTHHVGCSL